MLQLVNDLRTLRSLAEALLRFDSITFLIHLEKLRATESVGALWLFHDATHTIFEQASGIQWLLGDVHASREQLAVLSSVDCRQRKCVGAQAAYVMHLLHRWLPRRPSVAYSC